VNLKDTLLWWVSCGVDAVNLVADAVNATGSTANEAIIKHWNGLTQWPGYFGSYSFTATNHNGYPEPDVVMSDASSGRNGTFALAPGYS
jgi:branched-chain amino acid transport system substrate-binding protein